MGERAAPDPLFLPGPLISGGASFCLSPGPPFRSPRPPLPSSPRPEFERPRTHRGQRSANPFHWLRKPPIQRQCGLRDRELLVRQRRVRGRWHVPPPGPWAALCLTRHGKGSCPLQAMPSPVRPSWGGLGAFSGGSCHGRASLFVGVSVFSCLLFGGAPPPGLSASVYVLCVETSSVSASVS